MEWARLICGERRQHSGLNIKIASLSRGIAAINRVEVKFAQLWRPKSKPKVGEGRRKARVSDFAYFAFLVIR